MMEYFKEMFAKQPNEIIEGDFYYDADSDGDQPMKDAG